MPSASKCLDKDDVVKGLSAFMWNLGSLIVTLLLAVLALPLEDIPTWLLWIVPIAPFLNTVGYTAKLWLKDNRPK